MGYLYAGLWMVIGLILLTKMVKENKVFILAGIFFFFLGGWWLANEFTEADLFVGTPGIILKVISAVVLAIVIVVFIKNYIAANRKETQELKEFESRKGKKSDTPDKK